MLSSWRQTVRLVAVALLLLVGVEVLACDLVSAAACKLSNPVGHSSSDQGSDGSGDDCLCCCIHYSAPARMPVMVFAIVEHSPEPPFIAPLIPLRATIYHPPRS
jgi:hypothetical protein